MVAILSPTQRVDISGTMARIQQKHEASHGRILQIVCWQVCWLMWLAIVIYETIYC